MFQYVDKNHDRDFTLENILMSSRKMYVLCKFRNLLLSTSKGNYTRIKSSFKIRNKTHISAYENYKIYS